MRKIFKSSRWKGKHDLGIIFVLTEISGELLMIGGRWTDSAGLYYFYSSTNINSRNLFIPEKPLNSV